MNTATQPLLFFSVSLTSQVIDLNWSYNQQQATRFSILFACSTTKRFQFLQVKICKAKLQKPSYQQQKQRATLLWKSPPNL